MRTVALGLLCASLALAGGCPPPRNGPRPPAATSGPVRELNLMVAPSPVNLDETPGPDGLWARLYLGSQPAGYVQEGTFEFLLYEDPASGGQAAGPFHTWRFTAQQMRSRFVRDNYGLWCYSVPLAWGDTPPRSPAVTLVARYLPPSGQAVQSAPASIPMNRI